MNRQFYHRPCGRRALAALLLLGMFFTAAGAEQVKLEAALNAPVLEAGKKQTVYLKVGLTGFKLKSPAARPPANIAIVLDKSGSMSGEKIAAAREAAIKALDRLSSEDIVSVITYDTTVNVLVPATKLSDREAIYGKIRGIEAGGNTALFAGVSKASEELHKFIGKERVNRVVLLSDGLANVGPSSPGDLAELGSSLNREGIAVTTIGLGIDYNEDLMGRLAASSNGRHYFAREAAALAQVFDKEFGDVMSIVAQEVATDIECAPGVRPVRVLSRDGEISGQKVHLDFNQLYSEHERYAILEMEIQPGELGQNKQLADVRISYDNMQTKTRDKMQSSIGARFTSSAAEVAANENKAVMARVVEQIGVDRNRMAVELRNKGQIDEARRLMTSNNSYILDNSIRLKSPDLKSQAADYDKNINNLSDEQWQIQGKTNSAGDIYRLKQ